MPSDMTRRDFIKVGASGTLLMAAGPILLSACGAVAKATGSSQLLVGTLLDLDSLNPFVTTTSGETHGLVYDRLMVYDAQLKPALSLATKRSASPDGTQITWTLHPSATFHDGTPLTSEDVQFSYQLVKATGLSYAAPYVADLTSVEAPDDHTVVTTFSAPPADDPALFVWIVPKHLWEAVPTAQVSTYANSAMIGSGPFKFSSWIHSQSWEVVRNPKYWGPAPSLTSITHIIYQNPESEALALRQGAIDLTQPLSATIFKSLKGVSNISEAVSTATGFIHFGMNVWTDPKSKGSRLLLDRNLRRAISRAIDREQLVQLVVEGYGTPGSTIIMPAFTDWFYNIPKSEQLSFDLTAAGQMLDAAGYMDKNGDGIREASDGTPLSFRLFASTSLDAQVSSAQLIIPMLQKVGIELTLSTMTDGELFQRVASQDGDFDFFVWNWVSPPTPTFMLEVETEASFGSSADIYYSNPQYQALVTEETTETNFKKRQQLIYQAQEIFYQDAGYVVLFYMNPLIAYRTDKIAGWESVEGGIEANFTDAGILALKPA
jgi:peptide/nickel transport system substrate-binding protein